MNNPNKQLEIKRFLYRNKIGLFGLVETKIKELDFLSTLNKLGHYWEGVNNNNHHPGGRVWIIWIPQLFSVMTIDSSHQHITVEVTDSGTGDSFWYTIIYGLNTEVERLSLWVNLKHLKDICTKPWCVCGDFNSLLNYNERLGSEMNENELRDFRHCVTYCEVTDIQAHGSFFTWNNKHDPDTRGFSRIDRFLVNIEWMFLYPDSYAYFMNEGTFDHCPCICYRKVDMPVRKTSFRYFNMWSLAPNFHSIIQMEWAKEVKGVKMYQVVTKLRNLKLPLRNLNENNFSDVERTSDMARVILDDLQTQLHLSPHDIHISHAEREIQDVQGVLHQDPQAIEQAFLSYYEGLLGTSATTAKVHKATVKTGRVVNVQMAQRLRQPVSPEEIKQCFFSIPSNKSPGPDGYSSQFYKDSWDIVGPEICAAITDFFTTGKLLKQLNTTNITLIPKTNCPTSVLEFRPIACCNTIYKCIAKLLCSRLGDVLPEIVSVNQGGFIKGRNIVENVLICQDIVRLYNRKAASPRCLLKIDLRKAYDSVEWDFLLQMLTYLNFPKKFIGWIMSCVTSPTYSLSLNGNFFGFFKGKRGLRQGDPLSPLLLTLCMDYLSRILNVVGQQDDFRFHPMCGPLKLNHLLFADDLLLFSKGTAASIMWMLRAFATFSSTSGLCLNKEKTEIYFNGVPDQIMADILQVSGFRKGTLPFKYLGIPISSKKLTNNEGRKLTDKITARIRSSGATHLFYAGRLTLELPMGGKDTYWSAPAVGWDHYCAPKNEGGLGLKHSKNWNKAQLGKYIWWIASKKDHLWVKWISHVYLKGVHWSNYKPPADCCWSWKKIAHLMCIFKPAYSADSWIGKASDYSVIEAYNWLRCPGPPVSWYKLCWNSLNIPKASFIFLIYKLGRLLTKDRLVHMGGVSDLECFLCSTDDENHGHLFFYCEFSSKSTVLGLEALSKSSVISSDEGVKHSECCDLGPDHVQDPAVTEVNDSEVEICEDVGSDCHMLGGTSPSQEISGDLEESIGSECTVLGPDALSKSTVISSDEGVMHSECCDSGPPPVQDAAVTKVNTSVGEIFEDFIVIPTVLSSASSQVIALDTTMVSVNEALIEVDPPDKQVT
ncbi:uncharacterized protein LOC141618631 [Silene latifolia]|uniref:uncharacterized protein LOC141618631 n=1 Tax=Silene latifolia TaxID=37657 RepID=UPI003D76C841